MDFNQSRDWQDSASMYYDSKELNRISWLEPADKLSEFIIFAQKREVIYNERFTKEGYVKLSEYVDMSNIDEVLSEIWRSGWR